MRGDNVTISCSSTGYPHPTYEFFRGDQILESGDGSSYEFEANKSDAGFYSCRASNLAGKRDSPVVKVDVRCKLSIKIELNFRRLS